jgi:hypothetical protein
MHVDRGTSKNAMSISASENSPGDSRAIIRSWLDGCREIIRNGKADSETMAHLKVLSEAIEGLDALDRGKVTAIYAADRNRESKLNSTTVRKHSLYLKSITLRKHKLIALGFIALLREVETSPEVGKRTFYSVEQARQLVADAYRRTPDALKSWEKSIRRHAPGDMALAKQIVDGQFHYQKCLGWPQGTATLFRALNRAGAEFNDFNRTAAQTKPLRAAATPRDLD